MAQTLLREGSELTSIHQIWLNSNIPRANNLAESTNGFAKNLVAEGIPDTFGDLSIWQQVDSELGYSRSQSAHYRFWWRQHSGPALAFLLHNAEYPKESQYRDLKFFAEIVAPNLGVSWETGGATLWPSFMTDDHTPIEMSWDWGTGNNPPKIRYSIEPIGLDAGTSLDRYNQCAGPIFHEQLLRSLQHTNTEWFDYFKARFDVDGNIEDTSIEGHASHVFYAFDLVAKTTAKAYFFPGFRAKASNRSNLDVLSEAIHGAPRLAKDDLQAFSVFLEFASAAGNQALEYEMLAIDLVAPSESRLKIYFRSRETSFDSVVNIMTLGGRIRDQRLDRGINDLRCLWNAVFGVDCPSHQSLPEVGHRTAGILYNVEFKLGSLLPVAKIYLPVRHYSSSDEQIMQGLNAYLCSHQKGRFVPNYTKAMRSIL